MCLQNLPVTFCLDRAGLVGEDGPTHHGAFDLSWLRVVPNLTLGAPRDEAALSAALTMATGMDQPVALRYPRGSGRKLDASNMKFADAIVKNVGYPAPGKGQLLLRGNTRVTVLVTGQRAVPCMEAACLWRRKPDCWPRYSTRAGSNRCRKSRFSTSPPKATPCCSWRKNSRIGGFSSAVLELLADNDCLGRLKIRRLGLPDRFIPHGPVRRLRADVGINVSGIASALKELLPSPASAHEKT